MEDVEDAVFLDPAKRADTKKIFCFLCRLSSSFRNKVLNIKEKPNSGEELLF